MGLGRSAWLLSCILSIVVCTIFFLFFTSDCFGFSPVKFIHQSDVENLPSPADSALT